MIAILPSRKCNIAFCGIVMTAWWRNDTSAKTAFIIISGVHKEVRVIYSRYWTVIYVLAVKPGVLDYYSLFRIILFAFSKKSEFTYKNQIRYFISIFMYVNVHTFIIIYSDINLALSWHPYIYYVLYLEEDSSRHWCYSIFWYNSLLLMQELRLRCHGKTNISQHFSAEKMWCGPIQSL